MNKKKEKRVMDNQGGSDMAVMAHMVRDGGMHWVSDE